MSKFALFVALEAKPGQEEALAEFLRQGEALAHQEPGTRAWFAVRFSATHFAIFDTFDDEDARGAHLAGPIASALLAQADTLLASPPDIRPANIIGEK